MEISGRKVSYRKSTKVEQKIEVKTEPNEESVEPNDVSVEINTPSIASKIDQNENSKSKKKKKSSGFLSTDDDKTCATCGKSFPTRGRLELHMNVHKEDKEKPFKCDVCEKGFSASASLKNHKLLHTGEVHKCEYCEYTAVQKGNLKTHRLKLHKDLLEQNEVEGNLAQDPIADESEKVTSKEEIFSDQGDDVFENDGGKVGNEGKKNVDENDDSVRGNERDNERVDEAVDEKLD